MDFSGGGAMLYLVCLPPVGRSAVVKRLHVPPSPSPSSATITKSFCNEVLILSALRHPHLVRLHGHADHQLLLLIYDFVPNSTLSHHLHRRGMAAPPPLPWQTRLAMAAQIASTLEYLHFAVKLHVVGRTRCTPGDFACRGSGEARRSQRPDERWRGGAWTGELREVVYPPMLDELPDVMPSVEAVAEMAFQCVAPDKDDRPDAREALAELRRIQGMLCRVRIQGRLSPSPIHDHKQRKGSGREGKRD
ncbi:hypothetical protein ZWY2020_002437 [Hordeum vulgare]|nr:hypothetical protein ZWY2020_002437 [Hordeum vulgare]